MSPDQIDQLCEHCGETFSKFLHELAEKNAKVVCPNCGTESGSQPAAKPAASAPPKKTN
jgi:formylmethanofuran dehydrogenase subunit E